jgi:hypothetical protein
MAESARDKETKGVVDAKVLRSLMSVDRTRYICRGCDAPATPCSFEAHNKVRAYFRIDEHQPCCAVDGENRLVAEGKTRRISDSSGRFPTAYPNRLRLKVTRRIVDPESEVASARSATGRGREGLRQADGRRPYTANSLREVARQFVDFPYDRHLELSIEDIAGKSYEQIFWRVRWDKVRSYSKRKVFYAPLRWSRPKQSDTSLELVLDAGDRDDDKKVTRPYRLLIQWSAWSARQRRLVEHEINAARLEVIGAGETRQRDRAWMFFMGLQDAQDSSVFHVYHHSLVCCLVAEMLYPPRM